MNPEYEKFFSGTYISDIIVQNICYVKITQK